MVEASAVAAISAAEVWEGLMPPSAAGSRLEAGDLRLQAGESMTGFITATFGTITTFDAITIGSSLAVDSGFMTRRGTGTIPTTV